jgi:ParB-like nuclease domain
MLKSNSLTVQRVAIDSVRPSEAPLRRHPAAELGKIRKSFEKFGVVKPLLVTPNGMIVDGEARWQVLKEDGASYIDVIVIAGRSSAELKALRLMLNRSAMDAVWDNENLRTVFQELINLNFDLELTGFDPPEIDYHLNIDLPRTNVEENASDIPPVGATAVSSRGMIWAAGDHTVGCGDATDHAFVSRVLAGRLAHASFVDPPYNVPIHGFISGKGRNKHREFVKGAGELSFEENYAFLQNSLSVLKACCHPTALVYACIDWRHVMEMTVAGRACNMPLYQIATWVKSNAGMGGIYRNASEFIVIFRAGDDSPLDNVELGRRGRNRTNVWNIQA